MRSIKRHEHRELAALAIALVLAMSTWFSTAAVLGELRVDWDLSRAQARADFSAF